MRITSIICWSLSVTLVFLYSISFLNRTRVFVSQTIVLATSLAIALFFFSNPFARHYALEARPYALWLFLTLCQFILTVEGLAFDFPRKRYWWIYGVVSALLCMTASPGIFQATIGFGVVIGRWRAWKKIGFVIPALIIGVYYMSQVTVWGYEASTLTDYVNALKDVFHNVFRFKTPWLFVLFLLTAIFGALGKHKRGSKSASWMLMCCLGFTSLTFVLFLFCQWKHFFITQRQYIFLVPTLLWIYLFALYSAEHIVTRFFGHLSRGVPILMLIWAGGVLLLDLPRTVMMATKLPSSLLLQNAFGRNLSPACVTPLDASNERQFCNVNSICRGFNTCPGLP